MSMCHRSLWEGNKHGEAALVSRKCPYYQQVKVAYQEVQKGGNNPQKMDEGGKWQEGKLNGLQRQDRKGKPYSKGGKGMKKKWGS